MAVQNDTMDDNDGNVRMGGMLLSAPPSPRREDHQLEPEPAV